MTDTVIIGGGAAGMMAASVAARNGLDVVLLEPNKLLGRKLRITGKGRCNITNNCDVEEFLKNVCGDGRFLYSSLTKFSPADTITFFESLGVPLKTERGQRVFPVSDSAADVAEALEKCMRGSNVKVIRLAAKHIITQKGSVCAVSTSSGEKIGCRNAILCTGGLSYPATGSTGDGYIMAKELGHDIIPPAPSLVPLESGDDYCREMQGFSLKNVALSAYDGKDNCIYRELGEMLFTHFGVSGPLVLSASAHMRDFKNNSYRLSIDLKPGLDEKKLDARLLRDFSKNKNRDFKNSLGELAGNKMIPVLVRLSGIPGNVKVNSITREERQKLVSLFKGFPISISGPRPIEEAIITSGGIDISQINPRTMESKLVSGLFFAGEILDLDAYTGGFNLQIAWSTAYTAGNAFK